MRRFGLMLGLVLTTAVWGCSDDTSSSTPTADQGTTQQDSSVKAGAIIDHSKWTAVAAADDPFKALKPDADKTLCTDTDWTIATETDSWLDVHTENCNFLTVTQKTILDVKKGDKVTIVYRHQDLKAPDPGEAVAIINLGTGKLWEKKVTIPASTQVYVEEATAAADAPTGTAIYFHLHNHGDNTYQLLSIEK